MAMVNEMSHLSLSLNEEWNLNSEVKTFDKDTLLDSIINKAGTMEPIYTDPYFLAQMSTAWWKKWKPTFDKWWIASEKEYEPLWDRDGHETINDMSVDDGKTSQTTDNTEVMDDDTTSHITSNTVTNSASTDDSTTTGKVSAYDAGNEFQNHDQQIYDGEGTVFTTSNTESNGSDTDDRKTKFDGQVDGTSYNKNTFDHTLHSWGNWGISTTSQKLLKSEVETRYTTNLYDLMTEIFCRELLVRVF